MQHSNKFFDVIDRLHSGTGRAAAKEEWAQAGRGRARDDADAAGFSRSAASSVLPDYLESGRKHCDKTLSPDSESERYEVLCAGCRSRFCPSCCTGLGLSLRERLLPVLETFKGLLMWTFTIDPKLFSSPAVAFEYVRDHRCISRVMRELRRRGLLHSDRYFVVVEWQMGEGDSPGTEMAHWHVLVDSSFIPFDLVCELWNRFRPSWAGPVEGDRPGFGSVRFSAPQFADARHAANYACAYLIKYPEKGYPDWVKDASDIHRYSTSRGFWGKADEPEKDSDGGGDADVDQDGGEDENQPAGKRTTIRERLAVCGVKSVVMRVAIGADLQTGELVERREFVCRLDTSVATVAASLGIILADKQRRLKDLPRSALAKMAKFRERLG